MESRKAYRVQEGGAIVRCVEGSDKFPVGIAAPVISQGDLLGCVLLLSEEPSPMSDTDHKLAQTIANFLGKQMES